MNNEETQKAVEFLIEQQAQFVARMGKDEARLARLEESFVMLVELARVADQRMDRIDQRLDRFDERMAALLEAQARTDAKLAELADAQSKLTEAQAHTDERLNALIDVVDRIIRKDNNESSHN